MKQAFTLIELLVVILIIGILSAVALPQYKVAVLKSKYAILLTNTRSVMNALEVYYLANGTYPPSIADISVEIPGCTVVAATVLRCADVNYTYYSDFHFQDFLVQSMFRNFVGLGYVERTPYGNTRFHNASQRHCIADSGNAAANQVCKSLGGIPAGTDDFYAELSYQYTYHDWNKYELP